MDDTALPRWHAPIVELDWNMSDGRNLLQKLNSELEEGWEAKLKPDGRIYYIKWVPACCRCVESALFVCHSGRSFFQSLSFVVRICFDSCLPICLLPACLHACLFLYLSVFNSVFKAVFLSVCLSLCLSLLFILSVPLSFFLVFLNVRLLSSFHLSLFTSPYMLQIWDEILPTKARLAILF